MLPPIKPSELLLMPGVAPLLKQDYVRSPSRLLLLQYPEKKDQFYELFLLIAHFFK